MIFVESAYHQIISLCIAFFLSVLLFAAPASALLFDEDLPRETKVRNLNLIATGALIAWGVVKWDYFQTSPKVTKEKWFGHGTKEGGADKLGHLYSTYVLSHLFASIYQGWDYPEEHAMRLGAVSAMGVMALGEVGDSFSRYGFSYEDLVMNFAGAVAGYWLGSQQEWRQRLDLRLEYTPSLSDIEGDVITDYEHDKFLLALKADGFESMRNTPLGYLEVQLGYYARGYDEYQSSGVDDDRERTLYVGLGLNVGKLIGSIWETRVFNYLQLPYTYVPLEHSLD